MPESSFINRIPDDKDIYHRYRSDILTSVLESEGWEELRTCIQLAAGLRVRKYKLLELMQQVQISDESLNHSWKTYTFLQEAIGHIKVSCCRMSMQFLTIIVLPQLMSDSSTIVDCFLHLLHSDFVFDFT
jgi:hypothetical protein